MAGFALASLVPAVQSISSLYKFVEGGGMSDILDAIGDVHLEAAKRALESYKLSQNPREAVNRALGNFEVAHTAYRKIWNSNWRLIKLSQFYYSIVCDVQTCCLICICHHYLKNGWKLIEDYIEEAREAVKQSRYVYETYDFGYHLENGGSLFPGTYNHFILYVKMALYTPFMPISLADEIRHNRKFLRSLGQYEGGQYHGITRLEALNRIESHLEEFYSSIKNISNS